MSLLSDRGKRRLALGVLGAILFATVLGANLAVGADRTVTNAEFVKDGLAEEGVHEIFAAEMADRMEPDGDATRVRLGPDETMSPPTDEMAAAVVTPEYVRGEIERNVDSLYAYLDGDRDELVLAIDVTPIKEGFADEMEAWVLEMDAAAIDERMGNLTESESRFAETRRSFEEEQLAQIQAETDEELSRAELEAAYDDSRDRIRGRLVAELESEVANEDVPPAVGAAVVDYAAVGIDALVAEDPSYEAFRENETAARADLAAAVRDVVAQRLDEEVPDEQDLTEGTDDDANGTVRTVRSAFSLVGLLALVLPLVAVAAAGLVGYVSRRRSNALWRVGGVVAVAGLLGFATATVVSGMLPGLLNADAADASAVAEAMAGIGANALGTIGVQSLALFVLGLALVGAGIAVRRELVPIEDDPAVPEGD